MGNRLIPRLLTAGQEVDVPILGTYITIRKAAAPVKITVAGENVTMEAGDTMEFKAPFDRFTLTNPNANSLYVEFVVGTGNFTTRVINGDIIAQSGIQAADGQWYPDTRYTLDLAIRWQHGVQPANYVQGDLIGTSSVGIPQGNRLLSYGRYILGIANTSSLPSSGSWYVYDQRLNFVKALTLAGDQSGDAVNLLTEIPGIGFAFANAAHGSPLYIVDYDFNLLTSWGVAYGPQELCWLPTFNALASINGTTVELYDTSGNLQNTLTNFPRNLTSTPGTWRVTWDDQGRGVWVVNNGQAVIELYEWGTWTLLESYDVGLPNAEAYGAVVLNTPEVYALNASRDVMAFALEAFTFGGAGEAVVSGGGAMCGLLKKDYPGTNGTHAAVTVGTDPANGMLQLSGAIIQAALELYFGQYVLPDYLDHIYGVTFSGIVDGKVGGGEQSGNQSFEAVGFTDDFTVDLPQVISITVDNRLAFR